MSLILPAKEAALVGMLQGYLASQSARKQAAKGVDPELAADWAIRTTSYALMWLIAVAPVTFLIVIGVPWDQLLGYPYKLGTLFFAAIMLVQLVQRTILGAGLRADRVIPAIVWPFLGALWVYVVPVVGWITWAAGVWH